MPWQYKCFPQLTIVPCRRQNIVWVSRARIKQTKFRGRSYSRHKACKSRSGMALEKQTSITLARSLFPCQVGSEKGGSRKRDASASRTQYQIQKLTGSS